MTLPDERYRAVIQTRRFLSDLCDPDHTPRVPRQIRNTARSLLKHYPGEWDMERVSERSPEIFQPRMEPLTRMVMRYEQEKKNENSPSEP